MPTSHRFIPRIQHSANCRIRAIEDARSSHGRCLRIAGIASQPTVLLPATGYLPRLGVFQISGDRKFAWLYFDTRALPDGVLAARISAFDQPAGQNAAEIIAMPVREWELRH